MIEETNTLDEAIEAFKCGDPVLVFDADDREGETDLIYAAEHVTPPDVAQLRNDAGGLICVALAYEVAEVFNLPYLDDSISHPASNDLDLEYDERSSFSLSINHRDTYTGITDNDRARTITALADAAARPAETDFADEFRAPGHISVLKTAPNVLDERQGHTEFSIAIAREADCAPAAVVCEMLDDGTVDALSPEAARQYAETHGYPYLNGAQIIDRIGTRQESGSVSTRS
ncbi:3,4-dihydroxy-2-butanone-4-phosphate synthase [Natrinema gelatinilyticum]|uniref:3,4-dihydroxy-2-butanone-4-phosphate synthase n=1 Tax=Natrinema gelatinilyticum TaxID=2961571 RepID=UPI0020C4CAB7|nr:3,4-dihydroxy-2-butanone-4-phosphate synthase [Natrinema gelatinilyticum]